MILALATVMFAAVTVPKMNPGIQCLVGTWKTSETLTPELYESLTFRGDGTGLSATPMPWSRIDGWEWRYDGRSIKLYGFGAGNYFPESTSQCVTTLYERLTGRRLRAYEFARFDVQMLEQDVLRMRIDGRELTFIRTYE